ncbi:hypothetical protein AX17_004648 [Amanita inopinata Kibby_2008]|nr:hypothetical protein AX17_004648 [Amanita inopinata Kibby_2008]
MPEDRLDRLHIPLRGFNEIDEDTPSSGTASLPTPLLGAEVLHTNDVALVNATPLGPQGATVSIIRPPAAPLLKDYDSFTEGSRAGSFDFLSSTSGELFCQLDTIGTDMIGESSNSVGLTVDDVNHLDDGGTSMSIEKWRANVSLNASSSLDDSALPPPAAAKRPRSPTPDVVRRIRPRAQSLSSTSSAANAFDWFAPLPEGMDRPPSRASSAPD